MTIVATSKKMLHLLPRLRRSHPRLLCTSSATSPDTRSQKLDRIASELISLNRIERYDYTILFRLKLGLDRFAPSANLASSPSDEAPGAAAAEAVAEKTTYDVKLEKFDAAAKLKIIKEVRGFTELGLKEAKDLVEKTPTVVKTGMAKEDAEKIVAKLNELGASVTLE